MPTPLSPLTSSNQNSRSHTPSPPDTAAKGEATEGAMTIEDDRGNLWPSPLKHCTEAEYQSGQDDSSYSSARQSFQNTDGDEPNSFEDPLSSPFQYNGRDDTVDFPKLREMSRSGVNQHSTTPRKRSYEYGHTPNDLDERHTPEDRFKKGTGTKDIPNINVYADEDASIIHEKNMTENAGREVGHSIMEDKHNEGMSTVLHEHGTAEEKENMDSNGEDDAMIDDSHDPMDDTCLSTFSAIPDMTTFAKLRGDSPMKPMHQAQSPAQMNDPRHGNVEPTTPRTARRPYARSGLIDISSPVGSPTPRKREGTNAEIPSETPNLLDLMDRPNFFPRQRYSVQNARYPPSQRSPLKSLRESIRSPAKGSLLDFDVSPAPTPRSIPTITPRELESLKSGFMSEISSLRATLSGREAEVASLKQAVADAERRVGEALEEVRNEAARKEALEMEQGEWNRRGQEMEEVLRSVKEEIVEGEQEKERLMKRVEEVEKGKERLEGQIVELQSRLSAVRESPAGENGASGDTSGTMTAEECAREVQDAVEKVARELHTLYKSKHETKVAALKKSYEARWEKRVKAAENKLKAVEEENERLKTERSTSMPEAPNPNASVIVHEEEHETEKRVLEAQIKGLQQEMATIREDNERLHAALKAERTEKGELVAAVDEWLAMQQSPSQLQQPHMISGPPAPEDVPYEPTPGEAEIPAGNLKQNPGRSGIRPPSNGSNGGEKKIPRVGTTPARHGRTNSGGRSGIAMPTPGRGGIMSSIERMGRGGV